MNAPEPIKTETAPTLGLWRITAILCALVCALSLGGCLHMDPLQKHKILTTVFDGVPDLPSLDELCQENIEDLFNKYYEQRIAEAAGGDWEETKSKSRRTGSKHRPWKEKNCLACHNFQADNKLKLPKNKICLMCHKNFIQGKYVHGPVAVGACLACHNPHNSPNPSLLRRSLKTICYKCHKERRQAYRMHDRVISKGMYCINCHDPHSRNMHYFLK